MQVSAAGQAGFIAQGVAPLLRWVPAPDADAAHIKALDFLRSLVDDSFLPSPVVLTTQLQGNLGEFLTFFVGHEEFKAKTETRSDTANATSPLINISRDGIDIVWIFLADNPTDDTIALQEVKTTCTKDCRTADGLLQDYRRLFGTNLPTTLGQRLRGIKAKLDIQFGLADLAKRLDRFIQPSIALTQDCSLFPTLVYDPAHATHLTASRRVLSVRQTLLGDGWLADSVVGWTIELQDLEARLTRMCTGHV